LDTKPLEIECESLVQHELVKHELKVTKPAFDKEGADLLVLDSIKDQYTRYLKIQCKGRSLNSSSSITIPGKYVTENFLVFLYVKFRNFQSSMYIFFPDDIKKWNFNNNSGSYSLSLNSKTIDNSYFEKHKYLDVSAVRVKQLLSSVAIKKYSSLIVDEQFIERATEKTLEIYSKIHPDKNLSRPSVDEVIKGILSVYDIRQSKDSVLRCYIFSSKDSTNCSYEIEEDGVNVKVYREYTNGRVSDEIFEYIDRAINAENVALAADDCVYDAPLNRLHAKGVDIRLIQLSTYNGREVFTEFYWGDVMYAIAKAMGLGRYEW